MKIRVKGYKRFYKAISNKAHLFPVKVPIQGKNKSYYGIRWKSGTKAMEYIKKDNKIPKDTNMVFETKDGKKKGLTENQVLSLYEKTGKKGSLQGFIRANFKKPKAEDDGQLSFNDMAAGDSKQTSIDDMMNPEEEKNKKESYIKEIKSKELKHDYEKVKGVRDENGNTLRRQEELKRNLGIMYNNKINNMTSKGQLDNLKAKTSEELEKELSNCRRLKELLSAGYSDNRKLDANYWTKAVENGVRNLDDLIKFDEDFRNRKIDNKQQEEKEQQSNTTAARQTAIDKLKSSIKGESTSEDKLKEKDRALKEKRAKQREKEANTKLKPITDGEFGKVRKFGTKKIESAGEYPKAKNLNDFVNRTKAMKDFHLDIKGRAMLDMFGIDAPLFNKRNGKAISLGGLKVGGYCARNGFGDTYEIALVSETRNSVGETKTTVHECMHSKLRNSVDEVLNDITLNKPSKKKTISHDIEETMVEIAGQGVSNMIHGNDTDKQRWAYETIVARVAPMIWGAPEFKEARKNGLHGIGQEICKRLMNDDTSFVQNVVDEYLESPIDNIMNGKMEDRYKAIETKVIERTDKVEKIQQDTGKSDIANLVEELKRGTISLEGALHSSKYRELAAVLITKFLEDEDIEALEQLALSF